MPRHAGGIEASCRKIPVRLTGTWLENEKFLMGGMRTLKRSEEAFLPTQPPERALSFSAFYRKGRQVAGLSLFLVSAPLW